MINLEDCMIIPFLYKGITRAIVNLSWKIPSFRVWFINIVSGLMKAALTDFMSLVDMLSHP